MISPYAKPGYIDDTTVVVRLLPQADRGPVPIRRATRPGHDARPDSRPTVRERTANPLSHAFDFSQAPNPPLSSSPGRGRKPSPTPRSEVRPLDSAPVRTPRRTLAIGVLALVVAAACTGTSTTSATPSGSARGIEAHGVQKLDHLIFIVQENRSFDHYFGTYPGADGIPTNPDGSFAVCVPDRFQQGACVPPVPEPLVRLRRRARMRTATRCAMCTVARWTASSLR